jgi:hypothetical protein
MERTQLPKFSPATMAMYLLSIGFIYLLIKLLGYSFVPNNMTMFDRISFIIIVLVTINVISNRNEKAKTEMANVCVKLLPLIAIFFVVAKAEVSGLHILSYNAALICSMIIFYSCAQGIILKIVLSVLYFVSLALLYFFLLIALLLTSDEIPRDDDSGGGFVSTTVVKSSMSPNSVYLAELIDGDAGATGGGTVVKITPLKGDINILFGVLKKDWQIIYRGRWGEFNTNLRWETDEILYINEKKYVIK